MLDASSSEVLRTCSFGKEIAGTGSPLLERLTLGNFRKKNSFAVILRG